MKSRGRWILALAAVALTVGLLWYRQTPVVPHKATWSQVEAEARQGGYRLIGKEELRELYFKEGKRLLLVDTRQGWEYRSGHIKGALNFPLEPTWWGRWSRRGALAEFLGPDKNRLIVFY